MATYESLMGTMAGAFSIIAAMFIVAYFIQHVSSRKRRH